MTVGRKAKTCPQYLAGIGAALGALAAGATLGWSAPAEQKVFNNGYDFNVTSSQFSWIGSLVTLGAACSCLPSGYISNAIGLKTTMLILVLPFLLGWLLLIFSVNVAMVMVARFILGLTGGSFCITAPIYTTEIAQDHIRGILGSFFQQFLVIGVTYAYAIGPPLSLTIFNTLCALLPAIFFLVFIFMPESPLYLIRRGKTEAAVKSLERLRGTEYDSVAEANAMAAAYAKSQEENIGLGKALRRPVTLKALGISMALMMIQQLGGINAIIFYWTGIVSDAGSPISPDISTLLVGILMVVSTLMAVFTVDKLGRRLILLVSGIAQALTTFAIGAYFFFKERQPENFDNLWWLPIVSVCLFIIFFSVGYGPVPWLMMAELFTSDVKSITAPIAGITNWLCAFLVTSTFSSISYAIGAGPTFWIYTGISILGVAFVVFFVPETKGRSTEEIQELLRKRK